MCEWSSTYNLLYQHEISLLGFLVLSFRSLSIRGAVLHDVTLTLDITNIYMQDNSDRVHIESCIVQITLTWFNNTTLRQGYLNQVGSCGLQPCLFTNHPADYLDEAVESPGSWEIPY